MSLRTLSQNKLTLKRYNSTNAVFANYWGAYFTGGNQSSNAITVGRYRHLTRDSTGAICIVGTTNFGNDDALIMKYNTSGVLLWQRTLVSSNTERGFTICTDSSDNIYVAGEYQAGSPIGYFIAKYSPSGTLIWYKTHVTSASPYIRFNNMTIDSSGNNIFICGYQTATYPYGWIIAHDSNGDWAASRRFGANTSATRTQYYDMVVDNTNSYLWVLGQYGATSNILIQRLDFALTYDSAQTKAIATGYNGMGVLLDNSGNLYMISAPASLVKMDQNYTILWSKTFGATTYNYSMCVDPSNNLYVGSYISATGAVITKLDSSGNVLYQRVITSSPSAVPIGMTCDSFDNLAVFVISNSGSINCIFNLPGDGSLTGSTINGFTYSTYSSPPTNTTYSIATQTVSTSSGAANATGEALSDQVGSQTAYVSAIT